MLKFKILTVLLMTVMLIGCFNKKEAFKEIKKINTKGLKARLGANYERFMKALEERKTVEELKAILDKDLRIIEGYPLIKLMHKMRVTEKVLHLMLDYEIEIDAATKFGDTPLHLASRKGYLEIVQLLIKKGANVNAADQNGNTPLNIAINKNNLNPNFSVFRE